MADDASSRNKHIDLFSRIEYFFQRLETYTGIPPTVGMTDVLVAIMVEVLSILAIATNEAKLGPLSESMLLISTILN